MRADPTTSEAAAPAPFRRSHQDHWLVRGGLTLATLAIVGVLIVVPVVSVFAQALANGFGVYWDSLIGNADTRHSMGKATSNRWTELVPYRSGF